MDADRDRRESLIGATILVGVALALAGLTARLVHINTSLKPKLDARLGAQQTGKSALPSRRGLILDRNGRTLAGSRLRPSVFADPVLIGKKEFAQIARQVGPVLSLPAGQIEELLRENRSRRFCWLKRRLEPEEADGIKRLKLPGVRLRNEPQRFYPLNSLMAQTIGIVSRDGRGLEGVELLHDAHLRGRDGQQIAIYDGRKRRRPIWLKFNRTVPASDGGHVVLTLDAVIQGFVEHELAATVEAYEAESAVGVVMSPRTGEILAMGQYPTFDPNDFAASPAERRRNQVIADAVEPGSTFKPFVACGALAHGVVVPGESIFCHHGQHYFGRRLVHDVHPRGDLTFEEIIVKSSNIGMATLGERMGAAAIHETLGRFGFGSPTGVDLPGEASGMVTPLTRWTSYSTSSVTFGQEIAATPIQLATAFCAIVNGGTLLVPRVTKEIWSADGERIKHWQRPDVVGRILPADVADYMTQRILVQVVEEGGGKYAALDDWQVLGKTGTAQIAYADRRGYEPDAYLGSFIGAAPAENPEIVVLVMVRKPNPQLGYYGSKVAAPAVGAIMQKTLPYLGVPPSPPTERGPDDSRDTKMRLVRITDTRQG